MEINELVYQIQQGHEELIEPLWLAVKGFIAWCANRYLLGISGAGANFGTDRDDLIQSGYFALLDAVKRYDPERGSFLHLLSMRLKTAFKHAVGGFRREPLTFAASLDAPIDEDDPDGTTFLDTVSDPGDQYTNCDERIFNQQLHEALERCLSSISAKEAACIRAEYWDGRKLHETAEEMGISIERVRQHRQNGLRHIRKSAAGKQLERFLDDETSFYKGNSLTGYNQTQTSGVERKVLHRDRLRQLYKMGLFLNDADYERRAESHS